MDILNSLKHLYSKIDDQFVPFLLDIENITIDILKKSILQILQLDAFVFVPNVDISIELNDSFMSNDTFLLSRNPGAFKVPQRQFIIQNFDVELFSLNGVSIERLELNHDFHSCSCVLK